MTENKIIRTLIGKVVSNKMDKSATVLVVRRLKHPKYGKFVRRSSKIHFHDEKNECQIGDFVVIKECRPISKTKAWKLFEIKKHADQEGSL
ncbi:MAG: 30S ribosomal protein S17 [Gammaproteobacteria bacterium RIFCSPHIGHO2_12_FULL_38_14]|nr:MAG: 30S ribosomal protein S17 [Gammaproteobacteria bacterium RIFCSPHIGHO2_12_FULL_38_14]